MVLEIKYWIVLVAAFVPLIIGSIWYNPKVLGNAWMNAAGLNEEKLKDANMILIFGLTYFFSCLIGFILITITVHQTGFKSMVMGADESTQKLAERLLDITKMNYRTFKHGMLHGIITGVFLSFPILAIVSIFEQKKWNYIIINAGFWIISLGIMGGIVCQFA